MLKKFLAVFVLLVFLGVLAGCATSTDRPTDEGGLWGAIMRLDQWVKDHAW